jgi:hypothetical protein
MPINNDEAMTAMYTLMDHVPQLIERINKEWKEVNKYAPPEWAPADALVGACEELTDAARVISRIAYYDMFHHWPSERGSPRWRKAREQARVRWRLRFHPPQVP